MKRFLTTSAGTGGTISPASEWVNGGSSVQISATANSGYQFSGFTGAVNATTSPASLTVNAPAAGHCELQLFKRRRLQFGTTTPGIIRKAITISHTRNVSGSSSLSNFPVLISLATDSDLAAHAQSSGNDILFTDSTGTNKLNHEIETYNSATGQLIAWVQVPSLSPATDTVIYMYFGSYPAAPNQQNKTLVWDANYQGVWHLPERLNA